MYSKLKDHLTVNVLDLIPIGLATWRLSQALVYERGPFDLCIKLRELTGIRHDVDGKKISWSDTQLLSCLWCTSLWVAFIMTVIYKPIKYAFAASAIAILVEENLFDEVNNA